MSVNLYGSKMTRKDAVGFLQDVGVGTIAFGSSEGAYALPMSFGYDDANDNCIFQFAFGDGSEKRSYVEAGGSATLSVHERVSVDDWRSVVVRGPLAEVPDDERSRASAVFAAQAKMASTEVFREPMQEIDFEWYAMNVENLTGREAALAD